MKRRLLAALVFLGISTGGTTMPDAQPEMDAFMPEAVRGWVRTDDGDRVHTPDDLFEYIDGSAELFLSYGFRRLAGRTYARA